MVSTTFFQFAFFALISALFGALILRRSLRAKPLPLLRRAHK
jgi:hypothetical protein